MKIALIGCCYKRDIYSHSFALVAKMAGDEGANEVRLITSNCNCFAHSRQFRIDEAELLLHECRKVTLPYVPLRPSMKNGTLLHVVVRFLRLNIAVEIIRGLAFFARSAGCDLIHFDQVLKAFGAVSFLTLLVVARAFRKKVVVTIHEIDPIQMDHPALNRLYSRADRVVVFSQALKAQIAGLGIEKAKVSVIPFCVEVQKIESPRKRSHFIFFGGHHLDHSKGIETLFGAIKMLEADLSNGQLLVYTGNKCDGVEECQERAKSLGIDRLIRWSEFLSGVDLVEAYQTAIACLIPYESGSGKYPASMAMANGTPVIATKNTDVAEYVGNCGIFLAEANAPSLAQEMRDLMRSEARVESLARALRLRAEREFGAVRIEEEYRRIYDRVLAGP